MAAQHSPYTNLNYEQDINQKKRDWNSIPKLEDLPKDHKLVQSFSEGRLRLSPPLIFTQAGRRSFDGQFLGAALLGELLPSDVVRSGLERCSGSVRLTSYRCTGWSSRQNHATLVCVLDRSKPTENLKSSGNWRRRKSFTSGPFANYRMRSMLPPGETLTNMTRG